MKMNKQQVKQVTEYKEYCSINGIDMEGLTDIEMLNTIGFDDFCKMEGY